MASFAYRGKGADGSIVSGRIEARDVDAAAEALFGNRITPIEIKGVQDTKSGQIDLKQIFASSKITDVELITFARQMHNLTKAGLPLDRAIRGLEASLVNPAFKRVLQRVVSSLQRGSTLAEALSQHPKVFTELFINLVRVGENTGRLDLAFKDLARYIEVERTTSKQLKSATRYPSFVVGIMGVAIAVVTVFVIPAFQGVFERMGSNLPWQTQALVATSDFAVNYWPVLLIVILAGYGVFRYWVSNTAGAIAWDKMKTRMPIVGSIFERIALARFSKTFAILGRTGVPIVRALQVVSDIVGNKYIGQRIRSMADGVARGESLYVTAQRADIFLPLVLQMIAVGEESGNLPDLLEEVSDFYDSEVEYDLSKLTESIEPILVIFMAGLVLILALGVFLPVWELGASR